MIRNVYTFCIYVLHLRLAYAFCIYIGRYEREDERKNRRAAHTSESRHTRRLALRGGIGIMSPISPKSHRPRVSDRTMVGNCHPLLASAKEAAGRMRKNMTPRTSHKGEKQNHALEKCIAAANRGWMSEKFLPPADQGKCFYLTSPFIEPACFIVTLRG